MKKKFKTENFDFFFFTNGPKSTEFKNIFKKKTQDNESLQKIHE